MARSLAQFPFPGTYSACGATWDPLEFVPTTDFRCSISYGLQRERTEFDIRGYLFSEQFQLVECGAIGRGIAALCD
jgi:hypothetical protein